MEWLKGLFYLFLMILFIPVLVVLAAVEMLLGVFGIHFKDSKGETVKSWTDNKAYLGIGIALIPAVLLGGMLLYFGIAWVFCSFAEIIRMRSPLLIFLGIICPVVGSGFIISGSLKK